MAGAAHKYRAYMYGNAWSRVHVGCNLSEEFSVKVGIHQGSCLNPLLFNNEHGSRSPHQKVSDRMSLGIPVCGWPGDHVWIAGGMQEKLILRQASMEGKGLQLNMGKTKALIISGLWLDTLQKSSKDPSPLCHVFQGCWHKPHFLWRLFQLGRAAVVSLALWCLIPASGILDRPDQ